MTLRCIRCHRPLKHGSASGMGRVCAKTAKPLQSVERDLFGFDVPAACAVASERVRVHIEMLTVDALMAARRDFAAARRRAGVVA